MKTLKKILSPANCLLYALMLGLVSIGVDIKRDGFESLLGSPKALTSVATSSEDVSDGIVFFAHRHRSSVDRKRFFKTKITFATRHLLLAPDLWALPLQFSIPTVTSRISSYVQTSISHRGPPSA